MRASVQRYLGRDGSDIAWDLIRTALGTIADRAIAPLQDVMRLDDDARMTPQAAQLATGLALLRSHQLHEGLADGLRELTETYGRSPQSSFRVVTIRTTTRCQMRHTNCTCMRVRETEPAA